MKKFLGVIASMVFLSCFVMCELIVKIYRPQPIYSRFKECIGSYYAPSDFNRFTLKPNFFGKLPSMEYCGKSVTVTTNSLGLRNKEIPLKKPAGVKRILILGDSYTFGVYVENNETYPSVLEKLFLENGDNVEVINAGYADGYDADEQYVWLLNQGLNFEPDIIIDGFFIGNDIGFKSQNWQNLNKKGLPTKIKDPDLYVDEFGFLRSKIADNKTVGQQWIYRIPFLRESHLFVGLSIKFQNLVQRLFFKQDSPGGYSIAWYPQIFGKDILRRLGKKPGFDFDGNEKLFKNILLDMNEVSRANRARFIVLMIPFNFQVDPQFLKIVFRDSEELNDIKNGNIKIQRDYYKELELTLQKELINYINLQELMIKNNGRFYPKNGEVHFNPAGHKFTAEKIFEYITENHLLEKTSN